MRQLFVMAIPLVLVLIPLASAQEKKPADKDKNLEIFRNYLKKNYPKKKWHAGPAKLSSDALRTAYPGREFYYVFSAPPLPPGAALKELIDDYRKRMADYQQNYISKTVSIDDKGNVKLLAKPADFREGLMPVRNEEDAKVAAAAVISLLGSGRTGPGAVSPKAVRVTKSANGFGAMVNSQNNYIATANFDANGQLTSASKTFAGPLPP